MDHDITKKTSLIHLKKFKKINKIINFEKDLRSFNLFWKTDIDCSSGGMFTILRNIFDETS